MFSIRLPRRILAITLLMLILTSLPYVVATLSAPQGTHFGGAILDIPDYNSHLAKMQQGARGEWFYQLLFTAESHQPIILQTFYVGLGHISHLTGLSPDLTYQLARIISCIFMVWSIWAFMTRFLPPQVAGWALLLALFSGGLSFLLLIVAPSLTKDVSPIEFWLLDAYTFLSAFVSPHFAASIGLLALIFLTLDQWTTGSRSRSMLVLWLATLAVALIQPFDLLMVDIIVVIVASYRSTIKQIRWGEALAGLLLLGLTHAIILGYDLLVLNTPPVWKVFSEQNVTLSPPPVYYVLGYAPLLLPALGGIVVALRKRYIRMLIPSLWIVVVAMLIYAPLATQRRFVLGAQVPMAALAAYWFADSAIPWLRNRIGRRFRSVLLIYGAVATLSTIMVIIWLVAATRPTTNPDLYIRDNSVAMWRWIENNTNPDSVFLSAFNDGGSIVARTGRRVVLGHWIETVHYVAKRDAVQQFFSQSTDDAWRQTFLRSQNVSYVWYSNEERLLGDWNPESANYLHTLYTSGDIVIFRVEPSESAFMDMTCGCQWINKCPRFANLHGYA